MERFAICIVLQTNEQADSIDQHKYALKTWIDNQAFNMLDVTVEKVTVTYLPQK